MTFTQRYIGKVQRCPCPAKLSQVDFSHTRHDQCSSRTRRKSLGQCSIFSWKPTLSHKCTVINNRKFLFTSFNSEHISVDAHFNTAHTATWWAFINPLTFIEFTDNQWSNSSLHLLTEKGRVIFVNGGGVLLIRKMGGLGCCICWPDEMGYICQWGIFVDGVYLSTVVVGWWVYLLTGRLDGWLKVVLVEERGVAYLLIGRGWGSLTFESWLGNVCGTGMRVDWGFLTGCGPGSCPPSQRVSLQSEIGIRRRTIEESIFYITLIAKPWMLKATVLWPKLN